MTFLLALAGFGFLCVLRYYNENMMQHLWALSILGNRRIIQGMTAVFFLILIGVAGQALRKVSKENRSGIYYMATLLAVCLMPMFIATVIWDHRICTRGSSYSYALWYF